VTEEDVSASVRTSRVIRARLEELYAAFLDPTALVDWLPPAEMTGEIHRMSALFRGNTSDREDMVNVRFLELTPAAASSKPLGSSLPIRPSLAK